MLSDLIIPIDGLDTGELLKEWRWVVPNELRPFQLSKFGNWFFLATDGTVHLLCLLEGDLRQIAVSMQEFDRLKDLKDNRAEWYLDGFVCRCHAEGLELEPGECFGWRLHPMLGGTFDFDNIQKFSLRLYQCLVGQLLRQLQDTEQGSKVQGVRLVGSDDSR